MKRRSFLKICAGIIAAPLSFLKASAAATPYIGFPAAGGYVYAPYIPKVVVKTYPLQATWTLECQKDLEAIYGLNCAKDLEDEFWKSL